MSDPILILPLGDRALVIEIAQTVSEAATDRVRCYAERVLAARMPGVREVVPGFCSLTVHYDPLVLRGATLTADAREGAADARRAPFDVLSAQLSALLAQVDAADRPAGATVEIPVCYGGEHGEDLAALALAHEMSPARLIALHTAPLYFVGMLGFAPGFPYLAGLDERLITPRRATPRPRVPAGSVAIGGQHTGIYPLESPGGWHLLGRTPLSLFRVERDPPSLLQAGDRVRLVSITPDQFTRLTREQADA